MKGKGKEMDYEVRMLAKLQSYVDFRKECQEIGDFASMKNAEDKFWKCKDFVEAVTGKEVVMDHWVLSYK